MTTTTRQTPDRLSATVTTLEPRPTTVDLVRQVLDGDQQAWARLILCYTPLIRSVTRRYGLNGSDFDDVQQIVWLRLFEYLNDLREPRALPGWIRTTAYNETMRILKMGSRTAPVDAAAPCLDRAFAPEFDREVFRCATGRAIRAAFDQLSPVQRRIMECLLADPDVSYSDISRQLGIPRGSIGPTRSRCLEKLRAAPEIRALAS